MEKISREERDRVFQRYNELFARTGILIATEIEKDADKALETEGYSSSETLEHALAAIDNAIEYDSECTALERKIEEMAADGDPSAISLLLSEEVIMFRQNRAARVRELERIGDILTSQK